MKGSKGDFSRLQLVQVVGVERKRSCEMKRALTSALHQHFVFQTRLVRLYYASDVESFSCSQQNTFQSSEGLVVFNEVLASGTFF